MTQGILVGLYGKVKADTYVTIERENKQKYLYVATSF